jgi:hypothetical protein
MFGHEEDNQNTAVSTLLGTPGSAPSPTPPPIPQTPSDPLVDPMAAIAAEEEAVNRNALSPAGGYPIPTDQKVQAGGEDDSAGDTPDDILTVATDTDNLSSIKIQALDELYPLIDKLDLTPEERFRTLMMMIQASDNQELIQAAYDSAHTIEDEKIKAQALLDIVNEINYFTQHTVKP